MENNPVSKNELRGKGKRQIPSVSGKKTLQQEGGKKKKKAQIPNYKKGLAAAKRGGHRVKQWPKEKGASIQFTGRKKDVTATKRGTRRRSDRKKREGS